MVWFLLRVEFIGKINRERDLTSVIVKGWKEEIRFALSTSTVPTPKEQVHLISTQHAEAHRIHTKRKRSHTKNRGLIFHDHVKTTWMEYV